MGLQYLDLWEFTIITVSMKWHNVSSYRDNTTCIALISLNAKLKSVANNQKVNQNYNLYLVQDRYPVQDRYLYRGEL